MIHFHLAAAGGGAGGFSGGGGGEGGGHGAGWFIVIEILIRIAILGHGLGLLILLAAVAIWFIFTKVIPRARASQRAHQDSGRAARRKTAKRERRVELAAAEAAEDDPAFAPDVVKPAAAELFLEVQKAWDANDRFALSRLIAPDLAAEWARRLDELQRRGWRNYVEVLAPPKVEYVGLENRGGGASDRVTVRIEARMRDYVEDRNGNHIKRTGRATETVRVREFWTLTRNGSGRWILASIEQGAEGSHALEDKLVATPWSDEQTLKDEALVEQAADEAVPDGTKIAELADLQFEGDAHAAANDLSLADGRFAPDVLEVAARRAVAAWAEAVDGADARLQAVASPDAARQLLHPGNPDVRLVVRGPSVKQIRITDLDAGADPPTMAIELDVEGRRYIEDRDTTSVLAGSRSKPTTFTEHWTFALTDDPAQPWRIVRVGTPARL